MGTVTRAPGALGTQVASGETVVELRAGELQARLDQAQAQLDQVERELAREVGLVAKGASSAESVRLLEDRRRASAAAVAEATTLVSYTTVKAPFNGVITRRHAEAGDLAAAGAPLLELEATDRLRAEVAVPESLELLPAGTAIAIESAEGSTASGRLAEISPAADPTTRTRLAKIELPPAFAARSGQFIRVRWPAGQENALLIPASALTTLGQMEQVFVVADGQAQLRLVKTGGREGDQIRILSGLTSGETVVVTPPVTLRDGQPVEVRP